MPKTREQKQKIIEDLKDKLSRQKIVIFSDFRGLPVSKMQNLRRNLKKDGVDFKVAKKTLIKKSFGSEDFGIEPKKLEGEIALAFGYKDEVSPAKLIYKFAKENEKVFKILGGILQNQFIAREKILELAKLPSYQELLAKMLGSLNAPISGFASVLRSNIRNLVCVLSSIKK